MASYRQWLRTVNYYDDKGRVVQVITDDHKRGQDITTNVYDFVGRVTASKTKTIDHRIHWTNVNSLITLKEDKILVGNTNSWGIAFSSEQIPANADGWVEFTVSTTNGINLNKWFGMSAATTASTRKLPPSSYTRM